MTRVLQVLALLAVFSSLCLQPAVPQERSQGISLHMLPKRVACVKRRRCRITGISDRWRLNTAFADCTTSAALVQKHLPWKEAAIVRRSQCMLALRPDP